MGWQVFVLEILKTTDLMTIIGLSIIGFFLYDRAVKKTVQSENRLNERINQLENNLRDLLTATIKPIQEQVYNHIPTQIKAMDEKFDRKFKAIEDKFDRRFKAIEDKFDRKFDTLYELLINKGKDVKKEHTKDKERP